VIRIVLKIPEFSNSAPIEISLRPELGLESGPESIKQRILAALRGKELSKSQVATALGDKSIHGKLNQRIRQLLADEIIE